MIIKALLASATILAAAAPAMAQDVNNFDGARFEGRIGYEFVNSGVRNIREFGERGRFGDDASGEKPVYGGEAGFDFPVGNWAFGPYVGFEHTDTTIRSPTDSYEFKTKGNLTVGFRGGYAVNEGVLVFAKTGYSRGKIEPKKFLVGSIPTAFNDFEENRDGFHVGGGVEVPFAGNFFAKGEYVFHRYNSFDVTADQRLRFNRHQLVVGAGIRF